MPDEELFALAAETKLLSRTVLLAQVRRMLDDPRARDMVADFHNQFMDAKKFVNLQRDAKAFPNFATALGATTRSTTS